MNEEQTKIIQTTIFLIDGNLDGILKNDLLPYIEKANKLKEIITSK